MADRPVAVVTGAAAGIGRQLAIRLARLGYDLAAVDIDAEGLQELTASIKTGCEAWRADVSDADAWEQIASDLRGRRVGLLVNNAGLLLAGRLDACGPAELRRVVEVNLLGVLLGCRAMTPLLVSTASATRRRDRPAPVGVLNVASVFAPLTPPGFAAYSATKAGVVGLSGALRGEVRGQGLAVTAVLPGVTATGLFDKAHYADDTIRQATAEFLAGGGLAPDAVAEAALRAYRRRRRCVTIGRRAAWYARAKRWAPALVDWAIARRGRRALGPS